MLPSLVRLGRIMPLLQVLHLILQGAGGCCHSNMSKGSSEQKPVLVAFRGAVFCFQLFLSQAFALHCKDRS